jgi:Spy/CpxP family protein refolding chaperone
MPRPLLTLIAALLMIAPCARAQAMDHSHPQHADSAEHAGMMARLNLTPVQKTQIDAIHRKYGMHMGSAHDSSGMGHMKSMQSSDSTMKRAMAEVRAVLRPDQQAMFDSMMSEHMKHHSMHDSTAHHGMRG